MLIDAHIHADTRPYEDFEKMVISGIDAAITCAHDPLRMTTAEVVLDHFHRLLNNDIKRASANGLKLFVALGVHPRSISQNYDMVIEHLPNLLQNDLMVAIGEIGLETTSKDEINVFSKQLELADDLKTKVIVHTPRTNKKEVTEATTEIILENINPKLVLIDHVDFEIVDNLIDHDFTLGLTVQPLKMSPSDAVKLLKKYGADRFVLNSDISSSPSDPISVPRTVHAMRMADFSDKDIKSVSEKNATNFFNLKI
jgi:predicted metal-dependent TIM-barrel fold hydrolase